MPPVAVSKDDLRPQVDWILSLQDTGWRNASGLMPIAHTHM
jgi:hypothetical protein